MSDLTGITPYKPWYRHIARIGRSLVVACALAAVVVLGSSPRSAYAAEVDVIRRIDDVANQVSLAQATLDYVKAVSVTTQGRVNTVYYGWNGLTNSVAAAKSSADGAKTSADGAKSQSSTNYSVIVANQQRIDRNWRDEGTRTEATQDLINHNLDVISTNQFKINAVQASANQLSTDVGTVSARAQRTLDVAIANQQRIDAAAAVSQRTSDVAVANQQRIDRNYSSLTSLSTRSAELSEQVAALSDELAERSDYLAIELQTMAAESAAGFDALLNQMKLYQDKVAGLSCSGNSERPVSPFSLVTVASTYAQCAQTKESASRETDRLITAMRQMDEHRAADQDEADEQQRQLKQAVEDAAVAADEAAHQAQVAAEQAHQDAVDLRRAIEENGSDGSGPGAVPQVGSAVPAPSMPRFEAWVDAAACYETTFVGVESSVSCRFGPQMTLFGHSYTLIDFCAFPGVLDSLAKLKVVGGIFAVLGGFWAGLRALLSSFSMDGAVKS